MFCNLIYSDTIDEHIFDIMIDSLIHTYNIKENFKTMIIETRFNFDRFGLFMDTFVTFQTKSHAEYLKTAPVRLDAGKWIHISPGFRRRLTINIQSPYWMPC